VKIVVCASTSTRSPAKLIGLSVHHAATNASASIQAVKPLGCVLCPGPQEALCLPTGLVRKAFAQIRLTRSAGYRP